MLELLLSSSALDWTPTRRLLNLAPLFSALVANLLVRVRAWLASPPHRLSVLSAALSLAPLALWSSGLAWGVSHKLVKLGQPMNQAQLYGGGVSGFFAMLDHTVGTVAILPAELWFSVTRDWPRRSFGDAVFARWSLRDFRTLKWIDLAALHGQGLTKGLEIPAHPRGMRMLAAQARATFATQWPHVTDVSLAVRSDAPTRLRLGFVRQSSVEWLAPQTIQKTATLRFDVRALRLGSGLHELCLENLDARTAVVVMRVEFDDRETRSPIVEARR